MKDKTKWKILLYTINGLFWIQFICNNIMARCGEMPEQPAFGMMCGSQTLVLLLYSWVVYMMPNEKNEHNLKRRKILIGLGILLDIIIIVLFILQMATGKYYPFASDYISGATPLETSTHSFLFTGYPTN